MDLRTLLAALRRWAWLIVMGTLLAGGAAYVVSSLQLPPPRYEAQAVMLVGPALSTADANSAQMDAARRLSLVYVEVASSRPLLERVADELDLAVPAGELRDQLTVTTTLEPPIISVAAVAGDPDLAAAMANEVVAQLIDIVPSLDGADQEAQAFIQRQVEALELEIETVIAEVERLATTAPRTAAEDERLLELQSRLANLRGTYAALVAASSPSSNNQLTVIEDAVANPRPLPAGRLPTVLFASLVGCVLAISIAFLVEHLDDRVRSPDDIERISRLANLGEIGRMTSSERSAPIRLPTADGRHSSSGDSFRSLRTKIEFAAPAVPRSLLVASAMRREGRTTVAANLAVAFAQSGRSVVLVDCDLRHPALSRLFDLPDSSGLSELLLSTEGEAAGMAQQTSLPALRVITAGHLPDNPAELMSALRMRQVISQLDRASDIVIIDAPAILSAPETAVIASVADATLLVVGAGRTSFGSLREARDVLALAKAPVIGAVCNRVPASAGRGVDAREAKPFRAPSSSLQEDQSGP